MQYTVIWTDWACLKITRASKPVDTLPLSAQVVVLYVDQEESVRRQMTRAHVAALHNRCAAPPPPLRHSRYLLYKPTAFGLSVCPATAEPRQSTSVTWHGCPPWPQRCSLGRQTFVSYRRLILPPISPTTSYIAYNMLKPLCRDLQQARSGRRGG